MKRHYAVTAVAVVLIVWLSSDVLAQPGRPGAGIKPVAKAPPKAFGKPAVSASKTKPGVAKPAASPTTKPSIPKAFAKPGTAKPLSKPGSKPGVLPGVFPSKGGKPGLKPSVGASLKPGLGGGFSGLKPKAGISPGLKPGSGGGPGLKPGISPKLIAGKFPHGKPIIGPPALWHLHHHHPHHHHYCHWHHWNYQPWKWATWNGLHGWLGYPVRPIAYSYYVSGGYVYNGGTQITTVTQYAEQANDIAEAAEEQEEDAEWMSLGVFGVVPKEGDEVEVTLQLALAKDGTIGGTYRNSAVDVTLPLSGAVDEKTQRAAWRIGEDDPVVMETGVENLTKDKSTVLLHFENGTTETWTMIRMDESAAKEVVADLGRSTTLEQLAEAAKKLNGVLPDDWKDYLALPDEVSGGAAPDLDAVRTTLQRYDTVADDSKYGKITDLLEFQQTHQLLTDYVQDLSPSDAGR